MYAANIGSLPVVRLLLRGGADVSIADKLGHSADTLTADETIHEVLKENILQAVEIEELDWRENLYGRRDMEHRYIYDLGDSLNFSRPSFGRDPIMIG